MSEEIKPQRYDLGEIDGMMPHSEGDYVKYSDYEALRRATVSIETAQKLADDVKALQSILKDIGAVGNMGNKSLAQFNREKGDK